MRKSRNGRHATKTWMSRAEVARLLEVAPVTIGRWASEGKLPYSMTLGGQRRFRRDDVLPLVERLTNVTTARASAARRRHR
jgi:excisionase family DNA binding protein